jgi:hypothetical protein
MTEICENTTAPKPQRRNASFLPRFKDGGLLRRLAELTANRELSGNELTIQEELPKSSSSL